MSNNITIVNTRVKRKRSPDTQIPSWEAVLADLEVQIMRLRQFGKIVRKKIERGESWPTDANQSPSR
jgi:hypothetical protein